MEKSVIIEEYNSVWADEYEKEAQKIEDILSKKIISIEQIGTSAKGLWAMPIMAGVEDLKDADVFIKPLSCIGNEFVFHKEFPFRRFFRIG